MARGSKNQKKRGAGAKGSPVAKLTDDVLVDIISRVPYKSVCCCKCVSMHWRDLISHPDHRKKLPQTLAGFFYQGYDTNRFPIRLAISSASRGKITLSSTPHYHFCRNTRLDILDSCNGLLLCRFWKPTDRLTFDYVVCNPATEKWVAVPATKWSSKVHVAHLAFDPAVSSHFHVFEFIENEVWDVKVDEISNVGRVGAVAIYSAKAGVWTHKSVGRNTFELCSLSSAVFFNATLHLAAFEDLVVAVDVEGNNWRLIDNPFHRSITVPPHYDDPRIDIFLSQGQLYFAACTAGSDGELSVWALEDYNSAKWTLKHNVKCSQLLGINYRAYEYNFISFHPERNTIFIVCGDKNTLISYEMDCRESCFIYEFGSDHQLGLYGNGMSRYFQYVPLFTASLEDGN